MLPQSLIDQGYASWGFNPWIWPMPQGPAGSNINLVVLKSDIPKWRDVLGQAYLETLNRRMVAVIAPGPAYWYDFGPANTIVGTIAAGSPAFPDQPVYEPQTGFQVQNPDGSLTPWDGTFPPPTTSGAIPPSPTSNTPGVNDGTTIPVPTPPTTAITPVPATGGQTGIGGVIPQIDYGNAPAPEAAPRNMMLVLLAVAVAAYLVLGG